ncbi:specifically androgen-regulated gene protein [Gouania willdenowi]|uniref:Specifically androgen-regulated gene protein-like n=1 Tax=Gouania willdenowi TaxID=441366 RepID=A0A8C5GSG7_GOUWI|nr:specifically androgen-regulated gene protein-like [Gouania willdenowi]
MPQSITGLETRSAVDSAGSWDSVVSANSNNSDDSLEHLSAEEKACLMFLEETIESLDVEDGRLSTDELPNPGNLATKLADLSASLNKNKQGLPDAPPTESVRRNMGGKLLYSYLVPTPFVVANSSQCSVSNANAPKLRVTFKDDKPVQTPKAPPVPLEVNVVTVPPTKLKDHPGRTTDSLQPRGPLSYDALVHLRKSASVKKTPLCPTVDHTIDSDQHLRHVRAPNPRNPSPSDNFNSEVSKPKTNPPAVAPKPKALPANIPVKTSKGSTPSKSFYNIKNAQDPQCVRLEALQKLGLLKDDEMAKDVNRFPSRGPTNCSPSRSPSFCHSQVPPEPKNKALQSSASFHCYSRNDQQPTTVQSSAQCNRSRKVGMERSATVDGHRSRSYFTEQSHHTSAKMVRTSSSTRDEVRQPSTSQVVYTAMVVPGMGADRKEALRKLGLLKN